jgi:hypothetical protein
VQCVRPPGVLAAAPGRTVRHDRHPSLCHVPGLHAPPAPRAATVPPSRRLGCR